MIETPEAEADTDEATRSTSGETDEASRPPSFPPEDPPTPPWTRQELESALPLRSSNPDKPSFESFTGISAETGKRHYPQYIVRPSPGRECMRLKHVLAARDGRLPRSTKA